MAHRGRVVILAHDRTTDRTTDHPGLDLTRSEYADLRRLGAGAWKDRRWQDLVMPRLCEAAALVPEGRSLVVEVVEGPQVVSDVLAATTLPDDQVVYISKNLDTAGELKRQSRAGFFGSSTRCPAGRSVAGLKGIDGVRTASVTASTSTRTPSGWSRRRCNADSTGSTHCSATRPACRPQ